MFRTSVLIVDACAAVWIIHHADGSVHTLGRNTDAVGAEDPDARAKGMVRSVLQMVDLEEDDEIINLAYSFWDVSPYSTGT